MDGAIDYTKYSLHQLREADRSIDRDRFPKNYGLLQAELLRRGRNVSGESQELPARDSPADLPRRVLKHPVVLLWLTIPLSISVTILDWNFLISTYRASLIVETQIVTFALMAWLIYKLARGRNWSRIVILVMTVLGSPFYLFATVAAFFRMPIVGAICALQLLMTAFALYMLFTEPCRNEFQRKLAP